MGKATDFGFWVSISTVRDFGNFDQLDHFYLSVLSFTLFISFLNRPYVHSLAKKINKGLFTFFKQKKVPRFPKNVWREPQSHHVVLVWSRVALSR